MKRFIVALTVCAAVGVVEKFAEAQDDVADVPAVELQAKGDEQQRYFLIGAPAEKPAEGTKYGLIIVLPGGDGSAEFHPFVKRIDKHAVPEGYLLAQPIAVKWSPRQEVVWPTEKLKVPRMKFSTETFVGAVIDDVSAKYTVDPSRIFTLSWSSGGPAAYAISLSEKRVTGSLVAMSVFKPSQLPALTSAKDRAYFIYHSPDDRVCPFRMAEMAEKELSGQGARVKLKTYEGGHGWRGDLYSDLREGLDWLAENSKQPAKASP